ncbi:hypothetical protein HaLaN_23057 [Haematococcus lacustris]|uniref:Uncharacterized protein n=1 Tax=Haematococcus lacustris TaxID=44745 RepID=A0A699ZZ96_HAELA|nr:hypothetical protein HaLaN_23057 [Haematococcus lacustris]
MPGAMASYPNITGQRVACKSLVQCRLGAAKPRSTAAPSTTPSVNAVVTEVRPIPECQTPGPGATDVSSRHDASREDSRELGTKYEFHHGAAILLPHCQSAAAGGLAAALCVDQALVPLGQRGRAG